MRGKVVLIGLLAQLANGCITENPAEFVVVPCTITLSGALTETIECGIVQALHNTVIDSSAVLQTFSGVPSVVMDIKYKGIPAVGTYMSSDVGARGSIHISTSSSPSTSWVASTVGMAPGQPASGSWTITLTSVTLRQQGPPRLYQVHGTIDATLPHTAGAANVILKATF